MRIFSIITISFIFAQSTFADCGLSGNLSERINDCNKATKSLQLAYQKGKLQAWVHLPSSTIYFSGNGDENAKSWHQSEEYCKSLHSLPDLKGLTSDNWTIPSYKNFPAENLAEGFMEMRYPSSDFDEFRFWMSETFNHPSGRMRAAFYSNKRYFDTWFADAGDLIYRSVCMALTSK